MACRDALPGLIQPDWHVSPRVRAFFTTRAGGVSGAPYGLHGGAPGGLNLGDHVGDAAASVARNRARLPVQPRWLAQVHGKVVVDLNGSDAEPAQVGADAAITSTPGRACAVLVADCLPVLIADRAGRMVAAAHAGWRGLADGVLETTVEAMTRRLPDADLVAWLGPCIGAQAFEVGPEVRAAFLAHDPESCSAFRAGNADRWWCDLPELARRRLTALNVLEISGGTWCTASDPERFYSYRRDGQTGRMAAVVWLDLEQDP
jgi:YfiH family protein